MSKKTPEWKLKKILELKADGVDREDIRERLGVSFPVIERIVNAAKEGPRSN